jgi:hypothetical protein
MGSGRSWVRGSFKVRIKLRTRGKARVLLGLGSVLGLEMQVG